MSVRAKVWLQSATRIELARRAGSASSLAELSGRLITPEDAAKAVKASSHGDAVLKRVRSALKRLDRKENFPRTYTQKELHKLYTLAEMQHIYGKEFDLKLPELQVLLKTKDFERRIGVGMPRRHGKSASVSQHNGVMLACMDTNFIMDVFSKSQRQSKMLLKLTYDAMLKICPESYREIVVNNAESLILQTPLTRAQRVMNSYPGGVRNAFHFSSSFFSSSSSTKPG